MVVRLHWWFFARTKLHQSGCVRHVSSEQEDYLRYKENKNF